ncbi:MAG: mandelate racemase/muconate lactonizing enzyme family protein [Paracoccaceae bacterium]
MTAARAGDGSTRLRAHEVHVVAPPAPGWGGRYWILVKLLAEDGTFGWGECYAAAVGPEAMRHVLADVFERHMRGRGAHEVEWMFRCAHSSGFTQRPDPTVMGAFSGLEMACWDLLGQARGLPVHAMLGGRVRGAARLYTYLYPPQGAPVPEFWADPAMHAQAARAAAARGYTALKFDPAGPYTVMGGHQPARSDIARTVAICEAVRDAAPADILLGTHGQFTASGALRLARAVAHTDPLWFEEPVAPDDEAGLARVCAGPLPVAAGERLTTAPEFARALAAGVAVVQPALGRAGGLWQGLRIAMLAEAAGAQIAPHLYAGPVEWAANLHLAVTRPNLAVVETIETPFHDALIGGRIRAADGHADPGDAPGLGIAVDEDLIRDHPFRGTGLHLEMQTEPVSYGAPNLFAGGAPREG